ncbi:hypothetical protein, partial [Streptomyces sp. NPDC059468]|uniref:hypothetical protein n=1 Tax=Streptomyces sp. NPDC059468 TaxID=3346845 RepID=UPI00369BB16E
RHQRPVRGPDQGHAATGHGAHEGVAEGAGRGYNALEGTFLGGCLFSGRAAGRAAAQQTG